MPLFKFLIHNFLIFSRNACQGIYATRPNKLKSVEQARKNGLLNLLALAAASDTLSETIEVQTLLTKLNSLPSGKKSLDLERPSWSQRVVPTNKPWKTRIQKGIQPLDTLDILQPALDRETYLKAQCGNFLSTSQKRIASLEKPLFADNASEASDDISRQQFTMMRNDLKAAKGQLEKEKTYTVAPGADLEDFKHILQEKLESETEQQIEQEKLLLQSIHSALMANPESAAQFQSRIRSLPNIQELALLCSKPDGASAIESLYPELQQGEGENLKVAVGKFLAQKQFVQHLSRSLAKVTDAIAEKDADSRQLLLNDLGKSLDPVRELSEADLPLLGELKMPLLTLETILNIQLREDQIKNIHDFYAAQKEGRNIVNQMIMGAGKTAVIAPMLSILFAQPGKVSNVTVPTALYPLVKEELSKILSGSYQQFVFSDSFTRDLAKDPNYLKTYLNRLQEAKAKGAVTLMTPQQKYPILASLEEALLTPQPVDKNEQELLKARTNTLAEISRLLQTDEISQIDEIDMIADPTVVYKFAIGKKTPIHTVNADLVTDVIIELIQNEDFSSNISKDFIEALKKRQNPDHQSAGVSLSPILYDTLVVPKLATIGKRLLVSAMQLDLQGADQALDQYLTHFLSGTTPYDQDLVPFSAEQQSEITKPLLALKEQNPRAWEQEIATKKHSQDPLEKLIAHKLAYKHEIDIAFQEKFKKQEQLNLLGSLAKSIRVILKKSIFEEAGTHYSNDPDPGVYTVRPYSAPNSPKAQMPPDPYEILIKSIQNAYYNGVPRDAVVKILALWKTAAEQESEADNNKPLPDTKIYQKFAKLVGQEHANRLFESPPKKDLIDLLEKAINKDPESIKFFIKKLVIPQVGFYETSIEITPQGLLGMCSQEVAYTGTMSVGIFPSTMQANPALGTDGKTITVIANKVAQGTSKIMEMDSSQKSYLDQVLDVFKNEKVRVFIDSGNWLKEEVTEKWAEKLLRSVQSQENRENIKAVVFPNASGKWLCIKIQSGQPVVTPYDPKDPPPNERLTIIPSKHETGTNIKQIPTAIAFQSIRPGMTQRDKLQSDFRMREILEGQQLFIGVSKEVRDDMATKLLQSILTTGHLSGAEPAGDLPRWVQQALRNAGNAPRKMETVLAAGCKLFSILGKQERLWNYLLKNQIDDQLSKNYQALEHKMREVIDKPIRLVLNAPDSEVPHDTRRRLATLMKNFFVQTQKDSPYEEMTKSSYEVPIEEAVGSKIAKMQGFYELLGRDPQNSDLKQLVDANITKIYSSKGLQKTPQELLTDQLNSCVDYTLLPKSTKIGSGGSDAEIEQEQEQMQEQQAQVEQQVTTEAHIPAISIPPLAKRAYYPLGETTANGGYRPQALVSANFNKIENLVPFNIKKLFATTPLCYSQNLFLERTTASHYYLPAQFLLATKTPDGTSRYTLLSHEDAAKVKKGIFASMNSPCTCTLMDFDGRSICSTNHQTVWDQEELTRVITLAKLVTTTPSFQKRELELLDTMAQSAQIPSNTLKTMFEGTLKYKPSSAKKYQKSSLKKFFDMKARAAMASA